MNSGLQILSLGTCKEYLICSLEESQSCLQITITTAQDHKINTSFLFVMDPCFNFDGGRALSSKH